MKKTISLLCLLCSAVVFATGACPPINNNTCPTTPPIEIKNNKGLYIIKIPKERNSNIRPYVSKLLTYNKTVFNLTNAELVINAGYFDPKQNRI